MEKPIVLVIMDGVGKGDGGSGDAVAVAKTPTLDKIQQDVAVGLLHALFMSLAQQGDQVMDEVKLNNKKRVQT